MAKTLRLRRALAEDEKLILRWRSNDIAVKYSLSSKSAPTESSHAEWYRALLEDPYRTLYIGIIDHIPFGMVRFEALADNFIDTSIIIDEEYWSRGLSSKLLDMAMTTYSASVKKCFRASVLTENERSARCFVTSGFSISEQSETVYTFMREQSGHNIKHYLDIVDRIEEIRSRNNVNWMGLLRVALRSSPQEALDILRKINSDDSEINSLIRSLD